MIKKAQYNLTQLLPIALTILVVIITLSVGAQILTDVGSNQCGIVGHWNYTQDRCVNASGGIGDANATTVASNATQNGLVGVGEFASWIPTIVLVLVASIVIGIIVMAFAFRK